MLEEVSAHSQKQKQFCQCKGSMSLKIVFFAVALHDVLNSANDNFEKMHFYQAAYHVIVFNISSPLPSADA